MNPAFVKVFSQRFNEALALFRESIPVVMSRFGMQLISMSAVAAVGRYSEGDLAALMLALFPYFALVLISSCLGSGLPLFAAQEKAISSDASKTLSVLLRISFLVSAASTAFGFLIALGMYSLPNLPSTYRQAAPVMAILSLSIFGTIYHHFGVTFLQGLRKNIPSATTTTLGLILASLFSYFFVSSSGFVGVPLGAVGGSLALLLSRGIMAVHTFYYLHSEYKNSNKVSKNDALTQYRAILSFGAPVALSFGLKSVGLSILTFTLGFFSSQAVAVIGILLNLNLFLTMFPGGLSAVGAVRIAGMLHLLNSDRLVYEVRLILAVHAGWIALLTAFMIVIPIDIWASVLTSEPGVLAMLRLSVFGCWLLFFSDSTIVLTTGLLRALNDGWFSQIAVACSILLIAVPGAIILLRAHSPITTVIYLCASAFFAVVFPVLIRLRNLIRHLPSALP